MGWCVAGDDSFRADVVIGVFQGIDVRVLDALLDDSSTMLCLDNKVSVSLPISTRAAARGSITGH